MSKKMTDADLRARLARVVAAAREYRAAERRSEELSEEGMRCVFANTNTAPGFNEAVEKAANAEDITQTDLDAVLAEEVGRG